MKQHNLQKWRTTKSEYLVTDRWIRLRADSCETPEGHVIEPFYVLEYPDWVSCVVLSEDLKEITMLHHYRHGIDDFVLELPGGIVDEGESPRQTAEREMNEELGLEGATIHEVGSIYANPSFLTNKDFCFVAIGGAYKEQHLEAGDTFQMIKMPLSELLDKIDDPGNTMQSLHLATIFMALKFLKKQGHKLSF